MPVAKHITTLVSGIYCAKSYQRQSSFSGPPQLPVRSISLKKRMRRRNLSASEINVAANLL